MIALFVTSHYYTRYHFYYGLTIDQNHVTLKITKIGQMAKLKHTITIYVIIIKVSII